MCPCLVLVVYVAPTYCRVFLQLLLTDTLDRHEPFPTRLRTASTFLTGMGWKPTCLTLSTSGCRYARNILQVAPPTFMELRCPTVKKLSYETSHQRTSNGSLTQ